jgi:hypothetical protein
LSAKIVITIKSWLPGRRGGDCKYLPVRSARSGCLFRRADVFRGGWRAQPSEDRIKGNAELLFQIACQFVTEPTSVSDFRPVDATVQEGRCPAMGDEFDEVGLDVAQRAFRRDWRNAQRAEF